MEKALLEKMMNGTCDEIDKDMIASRCMKVIKETAKLVQMFNRGIEELAENYRDEMKLVGITIVAGVTDVTEDDDEVGFRCLIGNGKSVRKVITSLVKTQMSQEKEDE